MPITGAGVKAAVGIEYQAEVDDLIEGSNQVIAELEKNKKAVKEAGKEIEEQAKKEVAGNKDRISSWTEFRSMYSTVLDVIRGGQQIVEATFGSYSKLAEEVRDFALVSGTSAEESSRFLQVLDDFQLTAEDATAAARFLKEKGLSPNIETLIDLSRQFKEIQDPAKRLEFIQENLGRGGAKWVNILNQEEDALRENAAAISENLILNDEQIAKYEQQRLALDTLSDSFQGVKVAIGAWMGEQILAIQVQERAKEILEEQGVQLNTANIPLTEGWAEAMEQATREQESQTAAMMDNESAAIENEQAIEDLVKQQKELSDTISKQISLIDNIQQAEDKYTEQSKDLTEQRAEAESELATLKAQGWSEQSKQYQDALGKLDEIKEKESELAAERERQSLEFISQILAQNLARDGWTESEFEAFAAQQEAWGLWSADVVQKAKDAWMEADRITESINAIPTEKTVTVTVQQLGGYDAGSTEYNRIAYAGRDSGGSGQAGNAYLIGRGAQPEMFIPDTNGQFIPNADQAMQNTSAPNMDETNGLLRQIANQRPLRAGDFALAIRDAMLQAG